MKIRTLCTGTFNHSVLTTGSFA